VASLRAAYLEQRQKLQVQALYEQVQAAEEASHWEAVLKLGGQILALQPNDRDLQRRMAYAQAQLSGLPAKKLAWGWILGGIAALTLLIVGLSRDRGKQPVIPTLSPTAFPEKTASLPTSTPTSTPTLAPGDTRLRAADGMVMVYVPAGRFVMGSAEGDADEQPRHEVTLTGAWMDRTEVTNAQFAVFLTDQGNRITEGTPWLDLTHDACRIVAETGETEVDVVYRAEEGSASYPVVAVSWYGAAAYCDWIGGRLPTEAEWEYAARGARGLAYPWGQAFECTLCNAADEPCDGYAEAAPVGSFPEGASWCGTVDLAGNVWEWVVDWYDATYYQRSEAHDPLGPEEGTSRVVRGGSWRSDATGVRGSSRFRHAPSYVEDSLGFRCMMPSSQGP
jgi:formylglycine-generating enzyme required for sulfatase activity